MNVNDNRLVYALRQLALKDAAEAYVQMLAEPSLIESMSAEDLLLHLLEVEENARNKRRQEVLLKQCRAQSVPSPPIYAMTGSAVRSLKKKWPCF